MIRAILHAAAFIAVGLFLATVLTSVGDRIVPVHLADRTRLSQFLENSERYTAISAGNSHSRAIDFKALGLAGYHLWFAGSDIFETSYILRNSIPGIETVDRILIVISPTTFMHDSNLIPDRKDHRMKIYVTARGWPSFWPIRGDWRNLIAGKFRGIVRPGHWQKVFQRVNSYGIDALTLREKKKTGIIQAIMPTGHAAYEEKKEFDPQAIGRTQAIDHGERDASNALTVFRNDPRVEKAVYAEIVGLISFLRRWRIRPIFYSPPYTDVYIETLETKAEGMLWRTVSLMRKLCEDHGVEYHNFMQDEQFRRNYRLFQNMSHLNTTGAALFSEQLRKRILDNDH